MKTYIDGLQKALDIINENPCEADGYHYCSQQDGYKDLIKTEIKVSRVQPEVIVNFADRTKLTDEQLNDVCSMVKQWNDVKSKDRAIEELLELSISLLHLARNKTTLENLHKEMADVRLALEHLEFKYGSYQKELNEKLDYNSKISE